MLSTTNIQELIFFPLIFFYHFFQIFPHLLICIFFHKKCQFTILVKNIVPLPVFLLCITDKPDYLRVWYSVKPFYVRIDISHLTKKIAVHKLMILLPPTSADTSDPGRMIFAFSTCPQALELWSLNSSWTLN